MMKQILNWVVLLSVGGSLYGAQVVLTPETVQTILTRYTQVINTAGLLDQSFGTVGTALSYLGDGTNSAAKAVCLQPNGSIVVAGYAHVTAGGGSVQLMVARYTAAGLLDTTFGTQGSTLTSLGNNTNTRAFGACLQPDGKIVITGTAAFAGGTELFIARYTAAGVLDSAFGTNGYTLTSLGNLTNTVSNAVCLQPDGNIVVVGSAAVGGITELVIARYTTAGILDPTFGTNGHTLTSLGNLTFTQGTAVCLQPDGKIVVAGSVQTAGAPNLLIARYTSAGILDPTFGTQGSTFNSLGDFVDTTATAACLQPDGSIVAAGSAQTVAGPNLFIIRYTSAGVLDLTFGTQGSTLTSLGNNRDTTANAVCLQPDGKIVVAGSAQTAAGPIKQLVIARYTNTGTLDTTFGTNGDGATLTSLGGTNEVGNAMLVQPDGKLVVAGTGTVGGNAGVATLRYINPFTLSSFNASYGAVGLL